jgi:hypothetical protein
MKKIEDISVKVARMAKGKGAANSSENKCRFDFSTNRATNNSPRD